VYVYAWHYERRKTNPNIDPIGNASYALGILIASCLISVNIAGHLIFKYSLHPIYIHLGIGALSLIAAGLFNGYYIDNNRAIELYDQYLSSSNVKSPVKGILIAIFFMILPLILLGIFVLLFPSSK
jgi:hypothetical protein